MIVFDLECRSGGHRFEGWFGSSDDFAHQQARGLVTCPQCGCAEVIKAPMAPNLARKGNQRVEPVSLPAAAPVAPVASAQPMPPMPPQMQAALKKMAQLQAEALQQSRWVGGKFVEDARAMHYGDKASELIHGEASLDEARALLDEGIDVAPILFPIAPPDKVN